MDESTVGPAGSSLVDYIGAYVPPNLKLALVQAAQSNERSASGELRAILREHFSKARTLDAA